MEKIQPAKPLLKKMIYIIVILSAIIHTGCTKEMANEIKNDLVEEHLKSHSYNLAIQFPDYALANYDMTITVLGKRDNNNEWMFDDKDANKPLAQSTPVSKTAYLLRSAPGHTKSIRIRVDWKRKTEQRSYLVINVKAERNGSLYRHRSMSNQPAAGQTFPSSGTLQLIID